MDVPEALGQRQDVLDTDELLARLAARGVKNIEIAKALDLPSSRVPEIKRKERALKLDEAVKLVRAFGLEQDFRGDPLPASVLRLMIQYVAAELGVHPSNQQVEELTQDVRAFAEFVGDPKVRRSVEAAETFFQAISHSPSSPCKSSSTRKRSWSLGLSPRTTFVPTVADL